MDKINIIDYIPVGHKNAVTRDYLKISTGLSDRKIRELIEKSCNREHPILNMQDGKGYFQPSVSEMHLVRLYRAQENRRTLHIRNKVSEIDKYIKCGGNYTNELEKNQISIFDMPGMHGGD